MASHTLSDQGKVALKGSAFNSKQVNGMRIILERKDTTDPLPPGMTKLMLCEMISIMLIDHLGWFKVDEEKDTGRFRQALNWLWNDSNSQEKILEEDINDIADDVDEEEPETIAPEKSLDVQLQKAPQTVTTADSVVSQTKSPLLLDQGPARTPNDAMSAEGHSSGAASVTAADKVRSVQVCSFYRVGKCKFGTKGKNSKCKYYLDKGCREKECKFLHPKMCKAVLKYGSCRKTECTYAHPQKSRKELSKAGVTQISAKEKPTAKKTEETPLSKTTNDKCMENAFLGMQTTQARMIDMMEKMSQRLEWLESSNNNNTSCRRSQCRPW